MNKAIVKTLVAMMIVTAGTVLSAQDQPAASTPAAQAFEHYEGVRVALAADKWEDVAPHAKQLASRAQAAGGAEAKKAADQLAAATNIEDARKHFGDLSTILVPVFQAAAIPGVMAYTCPMKQKPWVQRGDKVENPYYGKAMLTCGSPLPPVKK
jgi:hypothetical protein